MALARNYITAFLIGNTLLCMGQEKNGAVIPWTTYEAEHLPTTGTVIGPKYDPYAVETESSGQRAVKLGSSGQFIELTASARANSLVIRFSLPDGGNGGGRSATLGLYKNGSLIQLCPISSRHAWLYGNYPFTNDPAAGKPRHFYDETRVKGLKIEKGDIIRIQRDDREGDNADYCIIDLVDLEAIAPPMKRPANALSIDDKRFTGITITADYTNAFRNCIAMAKRTGKTVWVPAGKFRITGDIVLPDNTTIQGAGMWYTELVGNDTAYTDPNKRLRLKGNGNNIHLADLALIGSLNYRSDKEPNDGIVGSFGTNSSIARIWIEHTKVGMWIENSLGLRITGCRLRNTMADGINLCVGMSRSTIENCTARGTGDDCFAIWPTVYAKQQFPPGNNLIIHCTAQLPYLANGVAVYGGESNSIKYCSFSDISPGSAILISTTFPTATGDKSINNNFSGTTVIEDCSIRKSGGFDHEWGWRAAIEICLDKRDIAGLKLNNLYIDSSLSNGLSVIAKNEQSHIGVLSGATLQNVTISNYGIGTTGSHGLFVSKDAHGALAIKGSDIPETYNDSPDFSLRRGADSTSRSPGQHR